MFSSSLIVLAVAASAFADIYVTSPTSASNFVGGQPCTVSWQEDNTVPLLAAFGPAIVSIYAGNSQQQTLLQTITPSVDVSTTSALVFTPDPTIGANADEYFVRFQSVSLMNAAYPALAFSAKFTMSGMTGTFNSSVQAEIDGQSTAPIGGTAAASASGASAPATSASATGTSVQGAAAKTTGASGSSSTGAANGAAKITGASMTAFVAAAAAIFGATFC
ncbi:hypothetical protein FIBSPDRAFT_917037 [Athelia psychrophila]|uniref:Yeast cell wall synthesis Kre9/Knh1-like N-terminal domain-containing protein n=1 Tax=Athelia psychrophila TaxID=1759441 RepID=A0A166TQ24_9AGAM|nr:hypothetical protein FIBSPDRAFT_917037 [Fibularhizoctonia sp. CBS 109695]